MLDGLAVDRWGPGVTLFDLPLHRLVNFLHYKALEMVPWSEDGKALAELESALDWPDIAEVRDLERADDQTRRALAALGIAMPDWMPGDGMDEAEAVN